MNTRPPEAPLELAPDDTQPIDIRALIAQEDIRSKDEAASMSRWLAYSLDQTIREMEDRQEVVPNYLYKMRSDEIADAQARMSEKVRLQRQEYHRTHPSPTKRFVKWLGGLAHGEG